ncbi:MAG: hypothetical protein IJI56_02525 [Firmicutes bacterium]|nr:hypothetical protein [Bacillota bacterium]
MIQEAQSSAIGTTKAVIYTEREGQWVEVDSRTVKAENYGEYVSAIATYKITSEDKRIKTSAQFFIEKDRNNKPWKSVRI